MWIEFKFCVCFVATLWLCSFLDVSDKQRCVETCSILNCSEFIKVDREVYFSCLGCINQVSWEESHVLCVWLYPPSTAILHLYVACVYVPAHSNMLKKIWNGPLDKVTLIMLSLIHVMKCVYSLSSRCIVQRIVGLVSAKAHPLTLTLPQQQYHSVTV